jgi:hypothetical protein
LDSWISFWQVLLIVGFTLFCGVVLFVIPFGLRDIMAMFRGLRSKVDEAKSN